MLITNQRGRSHCGQRPSNLLTLELPVATCVRAQTFEDPTCPATANPDRAAPLQSIAAIVAACKARLENE